MVESDRAATRLEPGRIRPTRRMLVVPVLGLVLWAAGANAGAGFLVVLAGGLVASVPWAFWSVRKAGHAVEVRRELPDRAVHGVPVDVTLHVTVGTLGAVVVHDDLTSSVGAVERPRDGARLHARVGLRRGIATGGVVTVEVTDPFGLFRLPVAGNVPSPIEVWPPMDVRSVGLLAQAARRQAEERPRRRGAGSETDGTREYRHGDSPRSVHWRSSARREELVVREFVGDAAGLVRVVIEPGPWSSDALDAACAMAAGLAESVQRGGAEAQVALDGRVAPWSQTGRAVLASLTPHLANPHGRGAPTIEVPGAVRVVGRGDIEVVLRSRASDVEVLIDTGGTPMALGVFTTTVTEDADAAPTEDPMTWLADRLPSVQGTR